MNSAIYSPSGASAGIGFAVPVDTIKRLVPQLIEHGQPVTAGIGVSLLADNYAKRMGVNGAIIYDVRRGSPADQAGLDGLATSRSGRVIVGDVIVAVNDKPVQTGDDLAFAFEQAGVGARVTLTVRRDEAERKVTIKLMELGRQ
jgi:S1-C subfamily serine protease